MEEQTVKKRILEAATELIRQEQDFEKVSMRRVAERAGVAVSMVNYHYQTKANLIDQAVQHFVSTVIRSAGESVREPSDDQDTPTERLRRHLLGAATFLAGNPGIARVSILRDLRNPNADDNTSQVVAAAQKQLGDVIGAATTEPLLPLMAEIQAAAMQHLFLRAEVIRDRTGLDYYSDEDRRTLIELVVMTMTGGWKDESTRDYR
jgi:AcrR family transcriptional regulator